ncbi:hypothetical protein KO481_35165 [Nocardia sp. NEAU-G5]|uniref:Uncharacterized protein n=1 Tax=Nocardia albiluteola TaxID=2842303 RepID=A0ABS6BBF1_9NOCA|nr:hypothetical protein [Nocardia albiluteola]MBU3066745.1 hypothetical protein [Nocardia albiluteola]
MASPNEAPQGGESDTARNVAVATVAVAIVGVAILVGVLLNRSNKDVQPADSSTPAAATTRNPYAAVPVATAGATQPHAEGDDCSHDHVAMRWQRREDKWVCAAPGLVSADHRVGDDCSHDGLLAHWVIGAGPAWACATIPAPDAGAAAPPQPAPQPVEAPAPVPHRPPPVAERPAPPPVAERPAPPPEAERPAPPPEAERPAPAPVPQPPPPPPPVFQLPPIQLPPIFPLPPAPRR